MQSQLPTIKQNQRFQVVFRWHNLKYGLDLRPTNGPNRELVTICLDGCSFGLLICFLSWKPTFENYLPKRL